MFTNIKDRPYFCHKNFKMSKLKQIVITFIVIFLIINTSGAINPYKKKAYQGYELGLRLGDNYGSGASIDAMVPFLFNRIHADLSFVDKGLVFAGLYNWRFAIADRLLFYPGFGGLMFVGDKIRLGVAGEAGIEYVFDIPLSLGFDWRPVIGLMNSSGFNSGEFGLNIRYRF